MTHEIWTRSGSEERSKLWGDNPTMQMQSKRSMNVLGGITIETWGPIDVFRKKAAHVEDSVTYIDPLGIVFNPKLYSQLVYVDHPETGIRFVYPYGATPVGRLSSKPYEDAVMESISKPGQVLFVVDYPWDEDSDGFIMTNVVGKSPDLFSHFHELRCWEPITVLSTTDEYAFILAQDACIVQLKR